MQIRKLHGTKSLTEPRIEVACHQSKNRGGFIFQAEALWKTRLNLIYFHLLKIRLT